MVRGSGPGANSRPDAGHPDRLPGERLALDHPRMRAVLRCLVECPRAPVEGRYVRQRRRRREHGLARREERALGRDLPPVGHVGDEAWPSGTNVESVIDAYAAASGLSHAGGDAAAGDRLGLRAQPPRAVRRRRRGRRHDRCIVEIGDSREAIEVIGSGLAAAVTWNLITWRLGLPSASSHALVGGLVGAAIVAAGIDAVNWGGIEDWHPVGVFGALIGLAICPVLAALAAFVVIRGLRRLARRAMRRWRGPLRGGEWTMSAALAFSHGANDAQKAIGVVAALLLATGDIDSLSAPTWVTLACDSASQRARRHRQRDRAARIRRRWRDRRRRCGDQDARDIEHVYYRGWPRCSSSTTGANGSHGASSIAAASEPARP
jgi:Phosphate transporter family